MGHSTCFVCSAGWFLTSCNERKALVHLARVAFTRMILANHCLHLRQCKNTLVHGSLRRRHRTEHDVVRLLWKLDRDVSHYSRKAISLVFYLMFDDVFRSVSIGQRWFDEADLWRERHTSAARSRALACHATQERSTTKL
jgi:hypothetical protein